MTIGAEQTDSEEGERVDQEPPTAHLQPVSGQGDEQTVLVPRLPACTVERRAIYRWMILPLLRWGLLLAVLIVVAVMWPVSRPWLIVPICVVGVVLAAKLFVEPFWRYRVHRWEITEKATYATTGWFVIEWRVSPISRIQTVDAVRGPVDRLLGLATLRVTTASSYGSVDVVGLSEATAHEAVARLASLAEITTGDAT